MDSHVARNGSDAGYYHVAIGWIECRCAARLRAGLRQIIFVAQPVVEGELGSYAPVILSEEEETRLAQAGIESGAGELLHEAGGLAQQERSDRGPCSSAAVGDGIHAGVTGGWIGESDFAGTMGAAVNALLLRAPDIGSPGNGVVAELLGEVAHPLELVLGFAQRAVATVHAERVAEVEAAISIDVEGGHTGGGGVSCAIQAQQACIERGSGTGAVRDVVRAIAIEAEAEIGDERRSDGVGVSQSQALIASV